jgi:hypothetical protein
MPKNWKTDSETIRQMWQAYFPDIKLTETRFFEKYETGLLQEAMRIATENRKNGKEFKKLDEENVGKYVLGILRKLKQGETVKKNGTSVTLNATVSIATNYKITEKDKARFKAKLTPDGDCLLFRGASTTGGYGKFWVNNRSVPAHYFAFFSEFGDLPAANGLGGTNGLQVAHNCRNRSCCNPRHLRLTTKTVNLRERVHKGVLRLVQSGDRSHYGSADGIVPELSKGTGDGNSKASESSVLGITDPLSLSSTQAAVRQDVTNSAPGDCSI